MFVFQNYLYKMGFKLKVVFFSIQIYTNFKEDMIKLQQTNKELDKDRKLWMNRAQSQVDTILRMTEANEVLKHDSINLERRRAALEKLCRQLQNERTAAMKKLKEFNVPPGAGSEAQENSSDADSDNDGIFCDGRGVLVSKAVAQIESCLDPDTNVPKNLDVETTDGKMFVVENSQIDMPHKKMLETVSTRLLPNISVVNKLGPILRFEDRFGILHI